MTVNALLPKRFPTARSGAPGHASLQTTLDRYGHLMPDIHEADARKLDRLVFGDGAVISGRSVDGAPAGAADAVQR